MIDAARTQPRIRPWEWAGLAVLMVVAALTRFVNLPTRGTWDGDQGHDMEVLEGLVRRGALPLLGPPTSIGDFHHGAAYYYLLAPSAALSGADPLAVVAEIALAGVLAIIVTWWLARSIGGPVAGIVAALLMTASSTSIDSSTFIWNPNLIALSSSVTLAAAWQAWRTARPAWWVVAAGGLAVTMQCHVLGIVFAPGIVALWIADVRRRPATGSDARSRALRWGAASAALIVLSYVPLMVNELTTDFSEIRAALDFVRSGGQGVDLDPISRLIFVTLRLLAWPVAGLITNAIAIGAVSAISVIVLLVWRVVAAREPERTAVRWLGLTLGLSALLLGFGVAGLATVTPLPTDHYHAFLDPIVFVIVGLGAAAAWQRGVDASRFAWRAATIAALCLFVAWNVTIWPPPVNPDGGWPAARESAARLDDRAGDRPLALVGLPPFKPLGAYSFPLEHAGRSLVPVASADAIAVICDSLWVSDCGGPAEEQALAAQAAGGGTFELLDRQRSGPRRTISLYVRTP